MLLLSRNTFKSLVARVVEGRDVLLLYFVPAFLYCLYNNLAFVNLSTFDPTTYYLLLQLRVVITGVLFQLIFKKSLSRKQWFSLCLLTVGCMLKQWNFSLPLSGETPLNEKSLVDAAKQTGDVAAGSTFRGKNISGFDLSFSAVLILVQTVCSCLAGVYNEYLLKHQGSDINIYVQNVFMYLDSIVCNLLILMFRGELSAVVTKDHLVEVFRFEVLVIMINNAAIGIITSFFLKYMNSILKTFASALELMFTALLSYLLFSIPIYLNTALAIFVVSYAIYLYSLNPVVNLAGKPGSSSAREKDESRKALMGKSEDDDIELQMEEV